MNYKACGRANIMDVVNKGEIYLTFVFDGTDSSQLGVASVSDGNTYDTPILPSFSDNSLEVDGYDGKYYFNTRIVQKEFTYSCFIDNLSAHDFEQLKSWLRPKKIGKLIRPEEPYVYYWVKIASIDNLGNIPLKHPDTGGVSYTGNFSITFTTVGQACGYGMYYYKDDLKYYEYMDIMTDTASYYDTGLLYKENMPSMSKIYSSGEYLPMIYNPGTYSSKIKMDINLTKKIEFGSITLTNKSTGDLATIKLDNLDAGSKISIDWEKNEYTINGASFSSNVVGDLMFLEARDFVESISNGFISNNKNNTTVYFNVTDRKVRSSDIGKTVMFNPHPGDTLSSGIGAKIIGIDSATNVFILDSSIGLLPNTNTPVTITKLNDLTLDVIIPEDATINVDWSVKPRYL